VSTNTVKFLESSNPYSLALKEFSPKTEVLPSITSGAYTDSTSLSWVTWTLLSYYNGLKRTKDEETKYKRQHNFKIHQKLEITSGLERGDSQREITALHNIGSSTVYDIRK
jgi:hypothetical protein